MKRNEHRKKVATQRLRDMRRIGGIGLVTLLVGPKVNYMRRLQRKCQRLVKVSVCGQQVLACVLLFFLLKLKYELIYLWSVCKNVYIPYMRKGTGCIQLI